MTCEKIKFYYFNLVDLPATDITGSTENAQFPASNLKHKFGTKVFRSTVPTADVVFDFKTAEPVDSIVISEHPLDGFGFNGSITIEANPTNVWSSPAFSTTLTPNAQFGLGIKTLTTTQEYRFWRISGIGSIFFELGKIFIGQAFQPQRNIGTSFSFESRDRSTNSSTVYSQDFTDERPDQDIIKGNINLIDQLNVDPFFDFINYVGIKRAFWVVLNETENIINDKERFAGRFVFRKKPTSKHIIRGIYNFTLTMEGHN